MCTSDELRLYLAMQRPRHKLLLFDLRSRTCLQSSFQLVAFPSLHSGSQRVEPCTPAAMVKPKLPLSVDLCFHLSVDTAMICPSCFCRSIHGRKQDRTLSRVSACVFAILKVSVVRSVRVCRIRHPHSCETASLHLCCFNGFAVQAVTSNSEAFRVVRPNAGARKFECFCSMTAY